MLQLLGRCEGGGRLFGDVAIVVFLLAQASDGILTYIGVATYGIEMEANPLIAWLMTSIGEAPGLAAAKFTAGTFGMVLHLTGVHRAVAALAVFYIVVAIIPWMAVLYVM